MFNNITIDDKPAPPPVLVSGVGEVGDAGEEGLGLVGEAGVGAAGVLGIFLVAVRVKEEASSA